MNWRRDLLCYAPQIGQQVVTDDGYELLGRVIQEVALQHIEDAVQSTNAAGHVSTSQCALQEPADRLCNRFILTKNRQMSLGMINTHNKTQRGKESITKQSLRPLSQGILPVSFPSAC